MNELRVGKAMQVHDITLIPLFRMTLTSFQQPEYLWLNGLAEPFAVVIVEPEGVRAVGVDENEIALATLHEQLPDLEATIEQCMAC